MKTKTFKLMKSPRYKTLNSREGYMSNVTVDSEGRIFLFDEEACPLTPDERFHFFQEVLTPEDWARVRAFYDLPKTKRRSNKSGGVRRYEGSVIGLYPKCPINVIQEERGKETGEKSWRIPAYGKAFRRMLSKDMAESGAASQTDEEVLASWPTSDDQKAKPIARPTMTCRSKQ